MCPVCGKSFYSKLSHFKRRKCCSKHCAMKNRIDIRVKKERIKIECKYCGKVFEALESQSKGKKYCSKECYTNWMGPQIKRMCLVCNKEFHIKPASINNGEGKYCSRKCYAIWQGENQRGENNQCWRGGKSREPYNWDFSPELKEKIRKRDNYICRMLGCNAIQSNKKFPIHHIDYNKQNNEPENLITLCHSCHSKTNHNRDYWQYYFTNKFNYLMEVDYGTNHQEIKAC